MNPEEIKKIQKEVETFFQKIESSAEIEVKAPEDQTLPIDLKVENPQILIGQGGQTLVEIQKLLRIILRKKIEQPIFVDLDINNYKKKKTEYLKEMARSVADEVALLRKEKQLPAMPAYERRIIHLELAIRRDVTSESIGEEPERSVIVRPYP